MVVENTEIKHESSSHSEVWFIHGANATPASFNYLRHKLELNPDLNNYLFKDVVYDCQDDLQQTIRTMLIKLPRNTPLYLIGHSLGGVIATAVAKELQKNKTEVLLKGVVVMGSPLGGSESATYLRWIYPSYTLFKSIATNAPVITSLKDFQPEVPFISLVTCSGNNPLFPTSNDGVVTVLSQTVLKGVEYVEMPFNHFEVLVSPETVDVLNQFFNSVRGIDELEKPG